MTTVNAQMQQRRDTAADWTSANPTLLAGEIGLETDTQKFKVGDGVTAWNSLGYWLTGGSGGVTIGAAFPAAPSQGDQHLLTVAPIFKCQLNGSPSNGATTLTVDNVTTGAETDTLVGHHLFLLDGSGKRIDEEGQISDTGAANTLNVNAKNWATDGWLDDAWVEVGARHSLWHYAEGRWKCPSIDVVELTFPDIISTSSPTYVDTGFEANIIAPCACNIRFLPIITLTGTGGSWTGGKVQWTDGSNIFGVGYWLKKNYYQIIFPHPGEFLSRIDAPGNYQLKQQWHSLNSTLSAKDLDDVYRNRISIELYRI